MKSHFKTTKLFSRLDMERFARFARGIGSDPKDIFDNWLVGPEKDRSRAINWLTKKPKK